MTQPNRYFVFNREFRVEQDKKTKRWWAVGHARGHRPYFLDKLGSRDTEEAMQAALNAWASRHGATLMRPACEERRLMTATEFQLI